MRLLAVEKQYHPTIFTEADERKREDVLVDRGRDCLFFGYAPGQEEGAEVIFDGA